MPQEYINPPSVFPSRPLDLRVHLLVTSATACLLAVDVAALALLLSGRTTTVHLGIRLLHNQDLLGAALTATALSAIILMTGWRWTVVRRSAAVGVVAMGLVALAVDAGRSREWYPSGDSAFLESYAIFAARGRLLVGPYSRFGWHHPGPLYLWLAAPFYVLANYQSPGMHAAVLAIVVASIVTVWWITMRAASRTLTVVLLAMLTGYVWRSRDIVLSVWNPYVPILPAVALAVVSSAIAAGRLGLLPLAALFASFVAQTHVGLLLYAVVMPASAVAVAVASPMPDGAEGSVDLSQALNRTMWVLVVLWIGPLAEQMTRTPGNMTRLWQFFAAGPHAGPPLRLTLAAWGDTTAGLLRPGFRFANGDAFIPSAAWWPLAASVLLLLLLVPAGLWLGARGRRFDACFAVLALVASFVALWSLGRIQGDVTGYSIVWVAAVGMLGASALAAAAASWVGDRFAPGFSLPGGAVRTISVGLVIACAAIAWRQFDDGRGLATGTEAEDEAQMRTLTVTVIDYLDQSGVRKPLLRMNGDTWFTAAGLGLQLQRAGRPFAVEESALPEFTDLVAASGDEDVELTFATFAQHRALRERPGNVVIIEHSPLFVDALPVKPTARR